MILADAWIQTVSGRRFWPLEPKPEDVCIDDIAHALAMKCRFTGHCTAFYSIAQHSVLVAEQVAEVSPELALWGLLHDAAEAYLPDVARPIKDAILARYGSDIETFESLEENILLCVAERFALRWPVPNLVKVYDTILLATERRDVMPKTADKWHHIEGVEPLSRTIVPLPPWAAKEQFLKVFEGAHATANQRRTLP